MTTKEKAVTLPTDTPLNQSLSHLLRDACRTRASQIAIYGGDASLSFAALDAMSDRVASWLVAQGIEKGDRVGLYMINSPEFVVSYFGIIKAGAVVVPMNLLQNHRELRFVIEDSGARGVIYHSAMVAQSAFLDDMQGLLFRQEIGSTLAWHRVWELLDEDQQRVPDVEMDPAEDLAVVLYTSGTTGNPKGAMLTHQNLAFDTWSAAQATELKQAKNGENGDILLVVLPMFHSFATSVGIIMPLLWGASLVPVPKFDPGLVVDTIAASRATVFLGVPSMYNVLLRLPQEANDKLKSLRLCVSGGAAMPVAIMAQFKQRYGLQIIEGDGPTECGPVTCLNPINGPVKPASVGLPIPGVEMDIRDLEGNPVPDDEVGEICVRGPNVMKGYWNLPEATEESFFDDWFRTGDLGMRDAEGYFFIVDRIKDMIIVNGMNVYPRMVEEVLYQHPDVAEAAVIGEPSETHGEIPVAYVVLKPEATQDGVRSQIRSFCKEQLGPHQLPRRVEVMDTLPKNAAGKIVKRELRKQGELERGVNL